MGIFGRLAGESASGASKWFQEGNYITRVRRCQRFESRQVGKGEGVAIEVSILETSLAYDDGRTSWVDGTTLQASNAPGEVCATILWIQTQAPALGNLKGFLLAASRLTEREIVEAFAARSGVKADGFMPEPGPDGQPIPVAVAAWDDFGSKACGGSGELLAGRVVQCRATLIKTKAGRPFTRVVWENATPAQVEQYEAAAPAAASA